MKTMLGHEEIPGTVVLRNFGNPGSVVAQGSRFPGGVGVVFSISVHGEARIFTGTALIFQQPTQFVAWRLIFKSLASVLCTITSINGICIQR